MQQQLQQVIACPKCFGKLTYDESSNKLICLHDQLAYTIIDDIPVLLETEVISLSSETN